MIKILKYTFLDVFRSRWTITYFLFFLISAFSLLYLSTGIEKAIISLMNITLTIVPLIGVIFGVMYYYNSRDFIELLLSQPIQRKSVFLGQMLGISSSLIVSYFFGLMIPFTLYGLFSSSDIWNFIILIICGILLTIIFVSLAYTISISNENKIKGFGINILVWLYFAVIYDGLVLLLFVSFNDYPLEKIAIIFTLLNPIDITRVMILLKLDISALMGFTGAVFNKFFGTLPGMFISFASMIAWIIICLVITFQIARRKDF